MKRSTLNLWIDILLFLNMWGLIFTGLLMHYILPAGQGRGRSLTLWGWNRHNYGDLHFYMSLVLLGLCIVHVWLHWSWVCCMISNVLTGKSNKTKRDTIYGIVFLVVFLVITIGVLAAVKTAVKADQPGRLGQQSPEHSGELITEHFITGRTTIEQAAGMCDMSPAEFKQALDLPPDVSSAERLGRLKRQYGLELERVRQMADVETSQR